MQKKSKWRENAEKKKWAKKWLQSKKTNVYFIMIVIENGDRSYNKFNIKLTRP